MWTRYIPEAGGLGGCAEAVGYFILTTPKSKDLDDKTRRIIFLSRALKLTCETKFQGGASDSFNPRPVHTLYFVHCWMCFVVYSQNEPFHPHPVCSLNLVHCCCRFYPSNHLIHRHYHYLGRIRLHLFLH